MHNAFRELRKSMLPNTIVQDDFENGSILHDVVAIGDEKKLQTLLNGNVDRTVRESKHGNTPLHEAARRGYSHCLQILCLPSQIKSDQKKKKNKLKKGKKETKGPTQRLILNIQNNDGFTALHFAAQNGHNQSCRELLLAGADPDVQNNYGDTALHTACRYGHAGATRILLSAFCNPNKVNLNGDTALHISCAMGKRKLTRILFEAGCDVNLRNAQDERPLDIAIRKRHTQILEILNNSYRMQNQRSKDKNRGSGGRAIRQENTEEYVNEVNWSPYGCHYFPDPRVIPSAKFETFPKEPLKKGEQYYLDLAGRIRKGPIGVGNTCYCGPFFRHIEDKLNFNQRNLQKSLRKARKCMGYRIQKATAQVHDSSRNDSQLTAVSPISGDSNPKLKHNAIEMPGNKSNGKTDASSSNGMCTLTRSRSLELLNREDVSGREIRNSRSCSFLEQSSNPPDDQCGDEESDGVAAGNASNALIELAEKLVTVDSFEKPDLRNLKIDYYNLLKSLKKQKHISSAENILTPNESTYLYGKNINKSQRNLYMIESVSSSSRKLYANEKSESSEPQPNRIFATDDDVVRTIDTLEDISLTADLETGENCQCNGKKSGNCLEQYGQSLRNSNCLQNQQNKVPYQPDSVDTTYMGILSSQQACSEKLRTSSRSIKGNLSENLILSADNNEQYQNSPTLSTDFSAKRRPFYGDSIDLYQNGLNTSAERFEIRNSEIKSLKKPDIIINGNVKELITNMEKKLNFAELQSERTWNDTNSKEMFVDSETSDEEAQAQSLTIPNSNTRNQLCHTQLPLPIPKDAYFHELPYRKKNKNFEQVHEVNVATMVPSNFDLNANNAYPFAKAAVIKSNNYLYSYANSNIAAGPTDRFQSLSISKGLLPPTQSEQVLVSPTLSHSDGSYISSDYEQNHQRYNRYLQPAPAPAPASQYLISEDRPVVHLLHDCQNITERDFSNDSGYCTQPCKGALQLQSPNHTTHTNGVLRNTPSNVNLTGHFIDRSADRNILTPYNNQYGSNGSPEIVEYSSGYISHLV